MPNSLQSSAMASPASRRATNCRRSSITEHSFHGITPPPLKKGKSVTYVSGTICHLCLRSLTLLYDLRLIRELTVPQRTASLMPLRLLQPAQCGTVLCLASCGRKHQQPVREEVSRSSGGYSPGR